MTMKTCPWCDGVGRQHSPNKTGDPMDSGVPCETCNGAGEVERDWRDKALSELAEADKDLI